MQKNLILSLIAILLNLTTALAQMTVSLPATDTTCNSSYNLSAMPIGGTSPYSYLWNTGATTQAINVTQSGVYTVTITDAVSSTASASSTIIMSTLQITGSTNCLQTGNTMNLSADISTTIPLPPYTYLWNNSQTTSTISVSTAGNYDCTVTDGTGCVSVAQYTVVDCPPLTSAITGTAFFDTNSNGIFDAGDTPIPYHAISLTPSNAVVVTDALGQYQLNVDTLISYTVTVTDVNNVAAATPTYTITFPNSGMVSSGNDFAFPSQNDLACYLTAYTNSAPGFPLNYWLDYENGGQYMVNGAILTMTYDSALQYTSATPAPTSIVGNTLTWNIGNLSPNAYFYIYVHFLTPVNLPLGTIVSSSANISPTDLYAANNTSACSQIVVGSWDPNDKSVSLPQMSLPTLLSGKELDYTVQFQNTGTAAAQTVVVMDTLDETKLDILSFNMLSSSHVFSLELLQNHILKWTFNNIQLPDSFSNEPESHGFVHYRIVPKNTLNIGDIIHNTAAIYFDFNPPIFTQDATTTIVSPDATDNELTHSSLSIIPNPAKDKCSFSFSANGDHAKQINLYNSNGILVYTEKIGVTNAYFQKEIPLKGLPSGMYFLQVITEKGVIGKKLIKE